MTIRQSRQNGEIVSIGDSQMLRSLRRIKGVQDNQEEINELFTERGKLRNRRSSPANIVKMMELEARLDGMLFVPEIIAIVIDSNNHYQYMVDNGVFINNKKFVRLLCGAGNARRNTVIFIDVEWEERLRVVLKNNHDPNIQISPAKYNAYFALSASASLEVSEPFFCVIKDCEVVRTESVEYVDEGFPDDNIIKKERELKFNLFDGMGLISPRGAAQWADELELDYVPSTFIIRNAFLKGMVCVFDFHKFAEEVGNHIIQDIWGNDVNIRDMDLILTASQFKLWNGYDSSIAYRDKCRENFLSWGVLRYAPKEDATHVFSNYQFLQALDIDDKQIKSLCSKTIDYFEFAMGGKHEYVLLYLLGKLAEKEYDKGLFDEVRDNVTRSVLLDKRMLQDVYVRNYLESSLNKKIKESYMGNLIMDGNYSIMIGDPYAFVEHAFNFPVKGLLTRGESYSHYWNVRDIETIAACRPPLTWKSEVNVLHLVTDEDKKYWYQHIPSGIIYNVHGIDNMLHADSDMDGDIIMTTDQEEFMQGAIGGFPINYVQKPVTKSTLDELMLYKADMSAFNSRIGFITNCSTTMYSMLPLYEEESEKHNEIIKRLKLCRKEQGLQIDKAKGLFVKPFPSHWTKWNRIEEDATEEEKEQANFFNSVLVDKRPYFMRYLYPHYGKSYLKFNQNYETFCMAKFGKELNDVLLGEVEKLTEEEQEFVKMYNKYKPLLDTPCVMNKICHYMERTVKNIKGTSPRNSSSEVISLMRDASISLDSQKLKALYDLYRRYKTGKRTLSVIREGIDSNKLRTIEQYNKMIRREAYRVSSDINELANLAVTICYEAHPSDNKAFAWNIFGEGIIGNMLKNITKGKVYLTFAPFLDKEGDVEYLGKTYTMKEIEVSLEKYKREDEEVYDNF